MPPPLLLVRGRDLPLVRNPLIEPLFGVTRVAPASAGVDEGVDKGVAGRVLPPAPELVFHPGEAGVNRHEDVAGKAGDGGDAAAKGRFDARAGSVAAESV